MRRALSLVLFVLCSAAAHGATFTVNDDGDAGDSNTADGICDTGGGACTLRAAIEQANALAGADTIDFSVAMTITPASAYPSINQQVTIDGTAAAGVLIDGAGTVAVGLDFAAGSDGSVLAGLDIEGFTAAAVNVSSSNVHVRNNSLRDNFDGITVFGTGHTIGGTDGQGNDICGNDRHGILVAGSGHTISDNFIGAPGGVDPLPNGEDGIHVFSLGTGIFIGAGVAGAENVISANDDDGIHIDNASAITVAGNFIGTDGSGSFPMGNGDNGIELTDADNNLLGGSGPINLISGNSFHGVYILSGTGNTILGSWIGIDGTGLLPLPNAGEGVLIESGGNTVGTVATGNVISGNDGSGVYIDGVDGAVVQNNIIGLGSDGDTIIGNFFEGVYVEASENVFIGTLTAGTGNTVSGNGDGISVIFSTDVSIYRNVIGLSADGTATRGNGANGISIALSTGVTAGSTAAPNIVSGNSIDGIDLLASDDNSIVGNYVGTNAAGTAAEPNLFTGIFIVAANRNTITDNLVSGNDGIGVELTLGATDNILLRNRIGVAADGTALGNGDDGVNVCDGAVGTVVGDASGGGNVIRFNAANGIGVEPSALLGNTFIGNTISDNDLLGIDHERDGVTPNDPGDEDTGPNNLQNFPEITAAIRTATASWIQGTLNSTPNTSVALHFYRSPAADPTGFGEGETYIGQTTVMTDGSGNATFNFNGPSFAAGAFVTGTGTGPDGTSELSAAVEAVEAPAVQFSMASHPAGEATVVTVTVTRTGDLSGTSTVDFATSPNTATAGSDYTHTAGTLIFAPAVASQTFNVTILGDASDEPTELINLTLSNLTAATLGVPATATIDIADDDPAPQLTISDVPLAEGNGGTTTFAFTVTVMPASGLPISVDYATANGTATPGTDYTDIPTTTLNIPAGSTTGTINVSVAGDMTFEPDETFFVNLTNPVNATVGDNQGTGTITNDDSTPQLTINDPSVVEGNAGTAALLFTVTLTPASDVAVMVDYSTANGTASGTDYTAHPTTTLTFAPGVMSQPVSVSVNGDLADEPDETVLVTLDNATNAAILDDQGTGTILDDDGVPSITIDNVTLAEGNAGTTSFLFTVSLSNPSGSTVTVNYATANGTATAGTDYTEHPATMLTFAPGVVRQNVTVLVSGELVPEPDETFFINLSNATNAAITDAQGLGTVVNDDAGANLSIAKTTAATSFMPGDTVTFTITVTNNGPGTATAIQVTDVLPAALTYVSSSASTGACVFSPPSTMTCTIPTLANAAAATITLNTTATGTSPISNTATVAGGSTDPDPANNTATAVLAPGGAIPTLSEWGLILIAMALALAAIRRTT